MKTLRLLLIGLFAFSSAALAQQPRQPQLPANIEFIRDVEYGKGGNRPLLLDITRPKEQPKELMPAIVWIHGGGWVGGNKNGSPNSPLAALGYFTVSISYRLSGEATFPAAIEDAKCAVRWLRANAEKYHIDPDRIGVWGGSAGGHLALLVGASDEKAGLEGKGGHEKFSSRVQAVCSLSGPADFLLRPEWSQNAVGGVVPRFLGGSFKDKPDAYKLASPVTHVTPDDPPVLMVHGDKDTVVPLEQSEAMLAVLKKTGIPAELITVKNADHGFRQVGAEPVSPNILAAQLRIAEFFDKHLKKK